MTPKLKKIIIGIVGAIILFIVYAVFIKPDPSATPLVDNGSDSNVSADAQLLGTQISQALLRIEQIKLDRSIFSSDIYRSLKDRSRPIIDEPMGRPNPFAPLGKISINSNTRVATSTATSTPVNESN
jgi:hypothetical protein